MRRLGWAFAFLLLLTTFADYGDQVWLPAWRPALHSNEAFGIDVSAHQGLIDWEQVDASGVRLAYVKTTEGATFVDPDGALNQRAATRAGVRVGAYHFFTFCSSGVAQAENFLAHTNTSDTLPPAVDLELAGNCAARPSMRELREQLGDFLAATGPTTILYVGRDFAGSYGAALPQGRRRWVRHLFRRPAGDPAVWQASDLSGVPGVRKKVDLDVSNLLASRPFVQQ